MADKWTIGDLFDSSRLLDSFDEVDKIVSWEEDQERDDDQDPDDCVGSDTYSEKDINKVLKEESLSERQGIVNKSHFFWKSI